MQVLQSAVNCLFCFFLLFCFVFYQFLSSLSVYSITSKVYIPKAFTVKEKTGKDRKKHMCRANGLSSPDLAHFP